MAKQEGHEEPDPITEHGEQDVNHIMAKVQSIRYGGIPGCERSAAATEACGDASVKAWVEITPYCLPLDHEAHHDTSRTCKIAWTLFQNIDWNVGNVPTQVKTE